jgi:ABC-type sugar transport system substrate-binding protein
MGTVIANSRRSRGTRTRVSGLLAAAVSLAVLAGCSSSGGSSPSDDSGSANSGGGAKVDEAKSLVAKYEAALTSFNLPAMKAKPVVGKKVIFVGNNTPNVHSEMVGADAAAKALGWTLNQVVFDPTKPTGTQDGFAQAVSDNPDGVITAGQDLTTFSAAAQQFAAKKIPVVSSATADTVTPPLIANVNDGAQYELAGRITANYIIAKKGADANVAMFNVPSYTSLAQYETGFKAEYLRLCPSCKYKALAVQIGDIGTKVPAQVVSTVQTDPKINFAVMGFGTISVGVPAALRTAGVSSLKIVGELPGVDNISGLLTGAEDMWVGAPLYGLGWKAVDALARHFNNEDVAIDTSAPTPYQILTKDNAPKPAALPEVVDYAEYFKKLWLVG